MTYFANVRETITMDPLENLIRANPGLAAVIGLVVAIGLLAFAYVLFGGRKE